MYKVELRSPWMVKIELSEVPGSIHEDDSSHFRILKDCILSGKEGNTDGWLE